MEAREEEAGGKDRVLLFCHWLHSFHLEFQTILVSKGKCPHPVLSRTFPHDWLEGTLWPREKWDSWDEWGGPWQLVLDLWGIKNIHNCHSSAPILHTFFYIT